MLGAEGLVHPLGGLRAHRPQRVDALGRRERRMALGRHLRHEVQSAAVEDTADVPVALPDRRPADQP
jgi:hypothetical protein